MSIVSRTGTFMNKDSTSSEANILVASSFKFDNLHNVSLFDLTMKELLRYGRIMLFRYWAISCVTVPHIDITGLKGEFSEFLCILGNPYIYRPN